MSKFTEVHPVIILFATLWPCLLGGCGEPVGGLGENAGYIELSSDRVALPADGLSSCAITAVVFDSSGAPAVIGTSVTFSTDRGHFGDGDRRRTVTTKDESGAVRISLVSDASAGAATVTATAGIVSQRIVILMGVAAGAITLSAEPTAIPADGKSSLAITATISDATGEPIAMGTPVTFSTTLGTFANHATTYTLPTASEGGIVVVSLRSGRIEGTAVVQCTVSGMSQSIQVLFYGETSTGDHPAIQMEASPLTIPADGTSASTVTATVTTGGEPAPMGTPVTFTTDLGSFSNGSTTYGAAVSDESGAAHATLVSGDTAGTATVGAEASGIRETIRIEFEAL